LQKPKLDLAVEKYVTVIAPVGASFFLSTPFVVFRRGCQGKNMITYVR